ncbi:hypothetical protein ACET3Z_000104 [Daucus carota]
MSMDYQAYTLLDPVGVVGHIIPWNFPAQMFAMKDSPSLAARCTMVVKPAEQTPLSALYYAHMTKLAGIPDGAVNIINGFGHVADNINIQLPSCTSRDIEREVASEQIVCQLTTHPAPRKMSGEC